MNDIDTIREVIKELDGSYDGGPGEPRNGTIAALAALERVSALNSDMESALDKMQSKCNGVNQDAFIDALDDARAILKRIKESR